METLAPNGTLTKFDAPLPPIRPLMPHLRSQDGMSFFSPTALFYIFLLSLQRDSVTAAADKAKRLAGDSRTEDVRHAIYYLILYYASSTLAR
ncbi:hypothetical protein V6N13_023071 [Hibiscus sabdariffa]